MNWWRRAAARTLGIDVVRHSPPCDRCGEPTGKPWLSHAPRSVWHCPTCQAFLAGMAAGTPPTPEEPTS